MWLLNLIPAGIMYGFIWSVIIAGVIGFTATFFTDFIPVPQLRIWASAVRVVSVIMMVLGVYLYGGYGVQMYWKGEITRQKEEIARLEKQSGVVTEKVVIQYKEKVKIVKEKGNVIIRKVPEYITRESDAKCIIPNSFVVLHDSAAKNEIPDPARGVDETASGVKLSEVAKTVTLNYNSYHQLTEQLKALQDWVKQQEKIYNGN